MSYCRYQVLPIEKGNPAHAEAVHRLYQENAAALHGTEISVQEWLQCLSADDPDEQNFLLYSAETPVGWLRINGLCNPDMAWISMLAIGKAHQRQGIGRFAVQFSEEYVREKGFSKLGIHTTQDNLPPKHSIKAVAFWSPNTEIAPREMAHTARDTPLKKHYDLYNQIKKYIK